MSFPLYISLSLILLGVDCIGLTAWQIFTGDFSDTPAVLLGIKLVLDAIFVSTNWHKIRFTLIEFAAFGWILFASIVGIIQLLSSNSEFNFWRILKDTIPPALFIAKLSIFRNLIARDAINLGTLIFSSLLLSILNIAIFYGLDGADNMYVGLALPINPAIAGSFLYSSSSLFLLALSLIYFGGKRAYLVSVLVLLIYLLLIKSKLKKILIPGFISRLSIGIIFFLAINFFIQGAMHEKILTTINNITISEEVGMNGSAAKAGESNPHATRSSLYVATAGRSAEIEAIVSGMSTLNWIFGHGAGFTYTLEALDGERRENYANSHFSPLGLTYKYGLPFALFFYLWILKIIFIKNINNGCQLFWQFTAILYLVQSFFAFNLFVEFLFPIALANLQVQKK